MVRMHLTICAIVLFGTASRALATEPLQDRIWYHSRAGTVHESGKGALALPPSEKLRAMAMAETCSAMGGPRGVYRYSNGRIWLVGLHRCSGGIGLHEVYPDVRTPPVASWLNGVLVARLGNLLCKSASGAPVHEFEVHIKVTNGAVDSVAETLGSEQMCWPLSPSSATGKY